MSICVHRHAELALEKISSLRQSLTNYYSHPPNSYYEIANEAVGRYQRESIPFHFDLMDRVRPGMSVLELGCGTAHFCPQVEAHGGSYTGIDHSAELLRKNRERFPNARFFTVGTEMLDTFDIVASLYTIEHVVDPSSYLTQMWDFCKPGGLIAIICPDFVDGEGFPPSFYYGTTPRRFREKITSLRFFDAYRHLIDLLHTTPKWKQTARRDAPGAFWINLRPRILHGANYSVDADAVHLPRLTDIVWWLEKRGGLIVETSRSLAGVPDSVLRHNCYALARKPA